MRSSRGCAGSDKLLFTPGPLTTSRTVKEAMMSDVGSRDEAFIASVRDLRNALLRLTGLSTSQGYEAILMQGSGTFGLESVIGSVIAADGKLLVLANGAYGQRMADIARVLKIDTAVLAYREDQIPSAKDLDEALAGDPTVTHVAVVQCETTTGIRNPIDAIGRVVKSHRRFYIVDSMSAFGGVRFDFEASGIEYLVSSSNKCIEGVPGFCFVICRRDALLASEGAARSVSLDLLEQWRGLERDGQFRFTPPTHTILAFEQAIKELEHEGGVEPRAARYGHNHETLVSGMEEMGFDPYLPPEYRSHIITTFRYPTHPNFGFDDFYGRLSDAGFVIYPGDLSHTPCFRIGHIGRLFERDVRSLLAAIRSVLGDMGIGVPMNDRILQVQAPS